MNQDKMIVFLAFLVWPFDFIIKSTSTGDALAFLMSKAALKSSYDLCKLNHY